MTINVELNQENLIRSFGAVKAFDDVDGFFVVSPDQLGFGYLANQLPGTDGHFEEQVNGLLNLNYPSGTVVQFCMYASPDIEETLHAHKVIRHGRGSQFVRDLVNERVEFLRNKTRNVLSERNPVKIRQVRVAITVMVKVGTSRPSKEKLREIKELRGGFEAGLKNMRMSFEQMDSAKYIRFMETVLNHGENATWRNEPWGTHDTKQFICNQLLDADNGIEIDSKQLHFGEYAKVRTLSMKHYPNTVYTGMSARYLGDLFRGGKVVRDPVLITANLLYLDPVNERGKINQEAAWASRNASGPLSRLVPEYAMAKDSFDTMLEALNDGDRPIRAYVGAAVFGNSEERVIQNSVEMQGVFRELGFQAMEDRYMVMPLFSQLLPFGADASAAKVIARYRRMATRHVVPMLPIMGSWRGTGTPMLMLIARDGNLMTISPRDTDGNMNVVVAAQSGMGKSFLSNELLVNYLSIGGHAWVIDKGYSYKPLCGVLDGDYVEFEKDVDICLNPFPNIEDWEEEKAMILNLLEVMAAPKEGFDDFQGPAVSKVLDEAWQAEGRDTNIDFIAQLLLEKEDQRYVDIGHQLYAWTTKGEYGRYFNGPNTCNYDNPLLILELQQLEGRQHLMRVVLLLLMYQIQTQMNRLPRSMPKLVLIDEAFALLATGETSRFIMTWYRQLRKFGASAVLVTQSINDLYTGNGAEAILENSAHMWLLGQKAESIGMVKNNGRLPVGDQFFSLLETVRTVKGEYSEILFRSGMGVGIGRLVVSKYRALLYSTDPADVDAIKQYRARGESLDQAIRLVLKDRGLDGVGR